MKYNCPFSLLLFIAFCLNCSTPASKEQMDILSGKINSDSESFNAIIYYLPSGEDMWQPFSNGIPQEATVSSFYDDQDEILATTNSHGIYSIKSGENKWKKIDHNLPLDVKINAITLIGGKKIIGTHKHGILISEDGDKSWYPANLPTQNRTVRCFFKVNDILLAGANDGVYLSLDKGKSWSYSYRGEQVNGFTEVNNQVYAATSKGVIVSTDMGKIWKPAYKSSTLHDISNDGKSIYAMTLGEGLLRSDNNGMSWEKINNGMGTTNLYTFEVKKLGNRIFAAQWYGIYYLDLNKSISTETSERTWRLINNGLPDSTAFVTLENVGNGLLAGVGLRK